MTEFVIQFGYVGLFVISFLASTILPIASELVVVAMDQLPQYETWPIILVATAGNFSGTLSNYFVGKYGGDFVLSRFIKVKPKDLARAQRLVQRWGPIITFFSWVPFVGDPLCVVAGTFRIDLRVFTFWVLLGKILRYVVLLGVVDVLVELFD